MKNESMKSPVAAGTSDPNGDSVELRDEIKRLHETLRIVERERDEYRGMLYGLLKRQFTEKDVVVPEQSDLQTFDEFVQVLEQAIHRDPSGAAT
jgi:hypothetical protein